MVGAARPSSAPADARGAPQRRLPQHGLVVRHRARHARPHRPDSGQRPAMSTRPGKNLGSKNVFSFFRFFRFFTKDDVAKHESKVYVDLYSAFIRNAP